MSDGLLSGVVDLRAPADITPARFFEEWLPSQVESFGELLEVYSEGISFAVSVKVTGDGGGEWTTGLSDGKPLFTSGLDPQALATITVSEENLVQSVTGQLDHLRAETPDMPADADLSPETIKQRAVDLINSLKEIEGSLHASVDGADPPLQVTVKFAGEMKDPPDCDVRIKLEDVQRMASGDLDPMGAFMAGKIQIEGDASVLLQLFALMA
ncbi:MAG: SCP2 sterol-binding domain-containing protein [Chloroflexi bacterium]|nr:SCP2 sterol-binding domain-containing protein [Chloroflexota bacterium]